MMSVPGDQIGGIGFKCHKTTITADTTASAGTICLCSVGTDAYPCYVFSGAVADENISNTIGIPLD
jgi:hypothetical protein